MGRSGNNWLQFRWPGEWGGRNITLKEILPVVLACAIWGQEWKGTTVVAHVDNQGAVAVLNAGYSKEGQIMHLMRCLFFITTWCQFRLRAVYIPGRMNQAADAISRDDLTRFFSLAQGASPTPAALPAELLQLLVVSQPDWTSKAWSQLFTNCFRRG